MKKPGDVIHSVLDLVYSDGYVCFHAQRVKGTLVPCSTKHFAVFADGDRNHKTPLDTARYQTFVTEWGLGRVRALEGKILDSAVFSVHQTYCDENSKNRGFHRTVCGRWSS